MGFLLALREIKVNSYLKRSLGRNLFLAQHDSKGLRDVFGCRGVDTPIWVKRDRLNINLAKYRHANKMFHLKGVDLF